MPVASISRGFFIMENYNFQKLTAREIQELQADKAMRVIEINCNNLADVEKELFDVIAERGKYQIREQQLKSLKSMIIEQNRALKTVVQNG